jgi:hypothetical protein
MAGVVFPLSQHGAYSFAKEQFLQFIQKEQGSKPEKTPL